MLPLKAVLQGATAGRLKGVEGLTKGIIIFFCRCNIDAAG